MKKNLFIITIVAFIMCGGLWLLTYATTDHKILPVIAVTGKPFTEIEKLYPISVEGFDGGMKRYFYFEGGSDSIAKRMFYFQNDICVREFIVPKGNINVERYMHYFNKNGMESVHGGNATPQQNKVIEARIISGIWHITSEGTQTNIYMESGGITSEGRVNDTYFVNTSESK